MATTNSQSRRDPGGAVATRPPKAELPTVPKALSDVMVGVRTGDPEREAKGRRDLAEAKLADYIKRTLDRAPDLTPAQVTRLSGLLRGNQR